MNQAPRNYTDPFHPIVDRALDSLWHWAGFAEKYWRAIPDRAGLGFFGTGYSDNWAVQTNTKYLASMAVLAAENREADRHNFSREKALERALAALRFCLATHHTGTENCADGLRWGRTWISGLALERMFHGVDRITEHLTPDDHLALRKMLADEAEYLCTDYGRGKHKGVQAGLWHNRGPNEPESNIWNGAICARAALYYPDHPYAARWQEQANLFFLNGISIPADAADGRIIAGKPLRKWHVGANFFPHYALDHHGYLNVGYMVICISNIAMLHYAYAERGVTAPESLYHHARDLWQLVRRLLFRDGRLLRIGGDSRIRWAYCQDYIVPSLVFAADYFQDPHAPQLLAAAVDLARREQALSNDGRYFSERLAALAAGSPYYYTRIESDKSVAMSQLIAWAGAGKLRAAAATESYEDSVVGGWLEPEHGAVFHRTPTRMASWSWLACENPQGLCLPPDNGGLAEWSENLAGRVHYRGSRPIRNSIHSHAAMEFSGGFLTWGAFTDRGTLKLADGKVDVDAADHRIVFAALPDAHTAIRLEWAGIGRRRVMLESWLGVKLEIPNDLLNGGQRSYDTASGPRIFPAHIGAPRTVALDSRWVNISRAIGLAVIYGDSTWSLYQHGERIGGHFVSSILTDTLCLQPSQTPLDIFGPATFLDNGCVILSSLDSAATKILCETGLAPVPCQPESKDATLCRAVTVRGQDHKEYLLVANFNATETAFRLILAEKSEWSDLASSECLRAEPELSLTLPAGGARLFQEI